MKILQVIPYFTPKRGGDVNACFNISKELTKKGHDVTIITTEFEFNYEYAESIRKIGIKIYPVNYIFQSNSFIYSKAINSWLDKHIKDFDIIHLHEFRSYQNISVNKYAKKYNIPYVLQAHGSLMPHYRKQNLKKLYDEVWGYNILAEASKVLALTDTEVKQYELFGVLKNRIEIVPNGIDLSQYSELPKKGIFRQKYHINSDKKIILYLGRLNETKGIDLLINAFINLSSKLKNCTLVLAGPDDGFESYLKNLVYKNNLGDKVIFTDFIPDHIKNAALVDADVFVTPKFSGFPITFLEACVCGTPIITTNKGDYLKWIHENAGQVINFDTLELEACLSTMLLDESLRKRLGENGISLIEREFNWEKVVNRIENIYKNIALKYED